MNTLAPKINSRNVAIILFEDIEVLDFAGPYEVFAVAGNEMPKTPYAPFFTYTVGLTEQTISTTGALRVTPHYSFDNCPAPDILLIPGGNGSRRLIKHPKFLSWLRDQAQRVEIIGSICTGALVLAGAGLLKGKRATTHHGAFERLKELESSVTVVADQRYVRDDSIWTAGGISAGIDMSLAIVKHLLKDNSIVVEEMEWMWHQ